MPYTVKDILRMEVVPALGCTEPSAVALCAAAAAALLPDRRITAVEVWLDSGIYKNALGVAIPGARGERGIGLAAALGALGGDAALRLEVLAPVRDDTAAAAEALVAAGRVAVHLLPDRRGLYVRARIAGEAGQSEAVIEGAHDRIVSLERDGVALEDHPLLSAAQAAGAGVAELEAWLSGLPLDDLVRLPDELDGEDLAFLSEGVERNTALAAHGLEHDCGLGIGLALGGLAERGLLTRDMALAARALTAAAADARMAGARLPAMSSAGSGNHGLTAVLPIWAVKDYLPGADPVRVLKAIALSHIITAYVKAHTGRLSAVCGCSVAAGAGAAAGITWLMGGDTPRIASAIANLIEDLAGVICDGAKASCSLKLATAAGTAVQAALFALDGIGVKATDGIIAATPEQTVRNVGELSTQGMIETERTVLRIMLAKQFVGQPAPA